MQKADIDIIIPVYNRADIVGRTLNSVAAQTVVPASVIFVDNNSTDDTASVLHAWADELTGRGWCVKVLAETTPGAAAARNRGFEESTAGFVMFFDSDDIMHPDHVKDFNEAIKSNPQADIIGRSVNIHTLDGGSRRGIFSRILPEFVNIFSGMMAPQRFAVRHSLIEQGGGWDPEIRGWDDIELGMRILSLKPTIVALSGKPTVEIISTVDSITGTGFSDAPEKWELPLRKMKQYANKIKRKDLAAQVDAKAAILAADYAREGNESDAKRLLQSVLSTTEHPRRMKLIYDWHKRFGRFAWVLILCLFGLK